jgi:hypothetical protein
VARTPALALVVALACATQAKAAPPPPLDGDLFSFPGVTVVPASAASAATALAGRWLGDEPHDNPAVAPGFRVTASPLIQRLNRQDLASRNRNFTEAGPALDGAGLAVVSPPVGRLTFSLHVSQPVLRFEEAAYTAGLATPGSVGTPPASVRTFASVRETRAGGGVSARLGPLRIGAGAEWTRREDLYRRTLQSGAPDDGATEVSFSGDGIGGQIGVRFEQEDTTARAWAVGAAVRLVPALTLAGSAVADLATGSSSSPTTVERAGALQGGVSARVALAPTFVAIAGAGARGAQRWEGYDVETGATWEWRIGGVFHDPAEPWTLRFGFGMERQSSVPEPRATVMAAGLGWRFADATVDLGVMRRTLGRDDRANSFDDRAVISISAPR